MFSNLAKLTADTKRAWMDWWPPISSTLVEIVFALVVSNLAIAITILVHWLITESAQLNLALVLHAVDSSVSPPEVIVYVLGFLAPALWIMLRHFRAWRHVPLYFLIAGCQAVVMLGSSVVFALFKAGSIKNADAASHWAWVSFVSSLVIWFITSLYEKKYLGAASEKANSRTRENQSGQTVMNNLEVPE